MLKTTTIPSGYMASSEDMAQCDWVLVGMPYDGTTSFRPGTRFGPEAIRQASGGLETYSPKLDKDLQDLAFFDAGDLDLPIGNREACLDMIRQAATEVLSKGKRWMGLGGEHLATVPTIQAYVEKYPNLAVVQFDAHADLRHDYLGETLSHACAMRRVLEHLKGPQYLSQIGIRSGPKSEWQWIREQGSVVETPLALSERLGKLPADTPIFVTIDLDVFDPSLFPGTGTPEPGGLTFQDFYQWLAVLQKHPIIGVDVMELSPHYDASGVSSLVAAKTVRECLLAFS